RPDRPENDCPNHELLPLEVRKVDAAGTRRVLAQHYSLQRSAKPAGYEPVQGDETRDQYSKAEIIGRRLALEAPRPQARPCDIQHSERASGEPFLVQEHEVDDDGEAKRGNSEIHPAQAR